MPPVKQPVGNIGPEAEPSESPDPVTANFKPPTQAQLARKGLEQDIEERKKYAERIFCLIVIWLFGVFLLLALSGFKAWWQFVLSDAVLLAVIGGTTINVLGLFVIVAKYLFPSRGSGK